MKKAQENKYCIVDELGNVLPNARIANRDTLKPIPDDEPIMIFRAKDVRTHQMIAVYGELCQNPVHKRRVHERLQDFKAFQDQHQDRLKEPD